jgi:hypothetical protein
MTSTCRYKKRKEMEEEYAALSKEVNKSVRKDYRAYVDSTAKEAQVAANQANMKGMCSYQASNKQRMTRHCSCKRQRS